MEVYSEKLPCVWKLPAGAFFWQINISGFFDMPIFWKSVFSLDFVIFILKIVPQAKPLYPSEAKAFPAAYGG